MSANIYWEPVKKNPESLYTMAPSLFIETLKALGWKSGESFTRSYLPALKALALTLRTGPGERNPYQQLVEAIEKHEEIRIWASY